MEHILRFRNVARGFCNLLEVLFTLKVGIPLFCVSESLIAYEIWVYKIFETGFLEYMARIFSFLMFHTPLANASKGRGGRGKDSEGMIIRIRFLLLHPLLSPDIPHS